MVKQLQSCCCGCSLRTGTIIIGFMEIFVSAFMIGGAIFKTTVPERHHNVSTTTPSTNPKEGMMSTELVIENAMEDGYFMQVMQIIMGCVHLVLAIMMTVGAQRNNPKLVYPWVIVNAVLTPMGVIVLLIFGIFIAAYGSLALGISFVIGVILGSLVSLYFILVVNSYHTTIMEPRPQQYTMA